MPTRRQLVRLEFADVHAGRGKESNHDATNRKSQSFEARASCDVKRPCCRPLRPESIDGPSEVLCRNDCDRHRDNEWWRREAYPSTFRVGTRSITAELPGECHLGCWAARALVVVLPSPGRWPASQELCPRLLHRIDACPACG